jgi:hypothetical protein
MFTEVDVLTFHIKSDFCFVLFVLFCMRERERKRARPWITRHIQKALVYQAHTKDLGLPGTYKRPRFTNQAHTKDLGLLTRHIQKT